MNYKINVAHIVLSLDVGGLEVLVGHIADNMSKYGYKPIIICLDRKGDLSIEIEKKGIPVYVVNRKDSLLDYKALITLVKILKKEQIQLIHTHNQEALFYGVLSSLITFIRPLIHTQHGLELPITTKKNIKLRIIRSFIKCFIGVSEDILKESIVHKWSPNNNSLFILNGVDTDEYLPDPLIKKTMKEKLGLKEKDVILVCVARLSPIKDHGLLIKAFQPLINKIDGIKLLIVGGGEEENKIINMIKELGLKDDVLMLGQRRDISNILKASDIFVMTSKSEGINVSLLESMSTGLPAVVTNVGGNKEVIKNGINGKLVPYGEAKHITKALYEIISTPEQIIKMGHAARNTIENKFSMKLMIEKYKGCYESVI